MSGVAALALREAIIPLQTTFKTEDLLTAEVEHSWTTGTGNAARDRTAKMYLPTCDDPSKKELFFYVLVKHHDQSVSIRIGFTISGATTADPEPCRSHSRRGVMEIGRAYMVAQAMTS